MYVYDGQVWIVKPTSDKRYEHYTVSKEDKYYCYECARNGERVQMKVKDRPRSFHSPSFMCPKCNRPYGCNTTLTNLVLRSNNA